MVGTADHHRRNAQLHHQEAQREGETERPRPNLVASAGYTIRVPQLVALRSGALQAVWMDVTGDRFWTAPVTSQGNPGPPVSFLTGASGARPQAQAIGDGVLVAANIGATGLRLMRLSGTTVTASRTVPIGRGFSLPLGLSARGLRPPTTIARLGGDVLTVRTMRPSATSALVREPFARKLPQMSELPGGHKVVLVSAVKTTCKRNESDAAAPATRSTTRECESAEPPVASYQHPEREPECGVLPPKEPVNWRPSCSNGLTTAHTGLIRLPQDHSIAHEQVEEY